MRSWVFVIALCLAPALLSLDDEVMEVDPAQYAGVSARLLRSGDWLHLEDMNGPFVNKPPLMFWAQAATMAALGPTSVAARLPALLFAALTVLGTALIGRRLGGERLGAVAAALVAGSVALHHMVADPKVDLALTAMTTLAVAAFLSGAVVTGWAVAGLAVLAKGPTGLMLLSLALLPELGRTRQPLARHLVGVLLLLAIAAPFYVSLGGGGARYLLWTQSFARVLGGGDFKDSTTPLYFVHTGLWALLPMSPLVVATALRGAARLWRERALPRDLRRVPAWWLALPFVVISASQYKLPQYVYWLAPPAALLAADELLRLGELALARWSRAALAVSVAAAGLGVAVLALAFPPTPWAGVALAGVLSAPLTVGLALRRQPPWQRTSAAVATSCLGFLSVYHAWLHPSLLEYQPWRELAAVVREVPGDEVLLVDVAPSFALDFYAQRALRTVDREALAAARPARFVVSEAALQALQAEGLPVASVARRPVYRVSIPRARFLLVASRDRTLGWVHVAGWTTGAGR